MHELDSVINLHYTEKKFRDLASNIDRFGVPSLLLRDVLKRRDIHTSVEVFHEFVYPPADP